MYASPVFHTYNDLYAHIQNKSLVINTTFVKAEKLSGHKKWVYDQPGSVGLGCSDIKFISDPPLDEQLTEWITQSSESIKCFQIWMKDTIYEN